MKKITDTEKWCPDCGQMVPLQAFGNHKYTKSGKRCLCKFHENLRHKCRKYGLPYTPSGKFLDTLCAICKQKKATVIDHDHLTGKVRGYLCHACNTGLGNYQDSPALLRKAAGYLESFS